MEKPGQSHFNDDESFTPQAVKKYKFPLVLQGALIDSRNQEDIRELCEQIYYSDDLATKILPIQNKELDGMLMGGTMTEDIMKLYAYKHTRSFKDFEKNPWCNSASIIRAIAKRMDWTPDNTGQTIFEYWKILKKHTQK